jgi:hypothetical protein
MGFLEQSWKSLYRIKSKKNRKKLQTFKFCTSYLSRALVRKYVYTTYICVTTYPTLVVIRWREFFAVRLLSVSRDESKYWLPQIWRWSGTSGDTITDKISNSVNSNIKLLSQCINCLSCDAHVWKSSGAAAQFMQTLLLGTKRSKYMTGKLIFWTIFCCKST